MLKPAGWQIWTVPLVHGRQTRRGAEVAGSSVRRLLAPIWHGFPHERTALGARLLFDDFYGNPTVFAVAEQKGEPAHDAE